MTRILLLPSFSPLVIAAGASVAAPLGLAFSDSGRPTGQWSKKNGWWRALVALVLGLHVPVLVAVDFDPSVLRSVASNNISFANDVAVSGNYAYVAAVNDGLKVFEISPSGAPLPVGPGYDTNVVNAEARGVAVAGDYAFVAFGYAGLHVVKISTPAAPEHVAGLTNVYAYDVAVSGNYAYVAALVDGLQVIALDLTNPVPDLRLVKAGSGYDPPGRSALAVAVSGNYAYVAFGNAGLEVIDISDPANPRQVGTNDTAGVAQGVAVLGHYAYVADGGAGLTVIDITDPTNLVGFAVDTTGVAQNVAVNDAYAFVADGNTGLSVIDIRNPNFPTAVTNYLTTNAKCVTLSSTFACVADGLAGLRVFSFNPANPQRVARFDTDGNAQDVAVSGEYAYVANQAAGLRVIQISGTDSRIYPNPRGCIPRSSDCSDVVCDRPGSAEAVTVSGNFAYVADGDTGLAVFNISERNWVGGLDTCGNAHDVVVFGTNAYVADEGLESGLRIIDISVPTMPVQVMEVTTNLFDAEGVVVFASGGKTYACVVNEQGHGLTVIDVSNPLAPQVVGVSLSEFQQFYRAVAVSENYAYVVGQNGLDVFDISTPTLSMEPTRVGEPSGNDVAISGKYAYVAAGASGLQVMDIRDPTNPQRVGGNNYFPAYGVTVSGDKVFVAAGPDGLVILDVFRPYALIPLAVTAPGIFRLHVSGPRNVSVCVQRSVNLVDWQDWQCVTPADGAAEVLDTDFATTQQRFYRVAP